MPSRSSKHPDPLPKGELAILREIRRRASRSARGSLRLGIGDDCALLLPRPGEELAVTTDLCIAGRHFRLDWHTPESVGHRALARGLSDLAAMGARPVAAFLSLGLPRALAEPGSRQPFLDGLLALADVHKTPLAGGDLSETPIPLADIVLIGAVPEGKALLRSGARAGDLLYVTGSLGGGAAALPHLDRLAAAARLAANRQRKSHQTGADGLDSRRIPKKLRPLLDRHLAPQPRIAQGLRLRGLASAAMDLSDGLSTDLAHLCEESRVAAEIDPALLPIHPGANLDYALHGGDDYELLFAARPDARIPRQIAGVAVTCIGRVLPARRGRPTVALVAGLVAGKDIVALEPRGWEHFS
jgi:thiamine-monophosphate kinase